MLARQLLYVALGTLALGGFTFDPVHADIVIGGFDATRGGLASFPTGSFFDSARQACQQNFDGVTFSSSPTLTPEYLSNVDVLVLSSIINNADRVTPLTFEERQALFDFVAAGGALLGLLDNQQFSETGIEAPFGLHAAGLLIDLTASTIVDPSSPLASGPFGTVTTFSQAWPGYFDVVPASCSTVAVNGLGTSLGTIARDALGTGSGPCAFYSDNQTFIDNDEIPGAEFSVNATLFLNTIAFLVPPAVPNATAATTWGGIKAAYR
jgi:hypothetical protein